MLTRADSDLLTRFLAATADLSPERAAEGVPGISGSAIRRFRKELPSRLTSGVRLAMRDWLAANEGGGSLQEPSGENGEPLALALLYAEKAAALRAEAAVIEARAAETRAMAFREAEQGATLRASRLGGVAPGQPISDEEIRELPPPPQQQGGRRRAAGA
jgi:hypothetical protein